MDINDKDLRDNLDIVVDSYFYLSYIVEPNRKIYFKFLKKGRVVATENIDFSFPFLNRDVALKMVDQIKHICGCEFQVERYV